MSFLQHVFRTKPLKVIHAEENSQELQRSLGLFDLLMIGIGGTVGSGIFATTGQIISSTAGPAAVMSWIIGGIVCCLNAVAYMELTTRIPSSGSTYAYAYHAIGELPAVIAAWLLTLEYGVSGAGVARSWADKVEGWIAESYPDDPTKFHWLNFTHANLLSAGIQAISVVILLMGVNFGKAFVNTITLTKIAVVLFIIFAGFAAMSSENLSPFVPPRDETSDPPAFGIQGIITGASQAFFGYIGFDEVCCLAAEAKNPKKIMPLAVIGVVTGTMLLSVFASFVLSGMVPYTEATDFSAGFNAAGFPWAAQIVHAGETLTMPVVVLISFLAQPRLNYALACDGLMPQIFAKVDEKGTIYWGTMISGIFFTVVAFLVPFSVLWDLVSFGILLSFIMSNTSLLMVRTRDHSPTLAPKLIGGMVFFSLLSTFLYQIGYVNNEKGACLVFAIIFFVGVVGCTGILYMKCPQSANEPGNFAAPFVPFIPMLSILADWYLIAQISVVGMGLGMGWVALAILSYFAYGFNHSAGRTEWNALLNFLPHGDRMSTPMLSMNEVRPSMSSMMKEKENKM